MIIQVDALLHCNHHSKSPGPALRGRWVSAREVSHCVVSGVQYLFSSLIVTNEARNHSGRQCQPNPTLHSVCRAGPMHNNDNHVRSNPGNEVPNLSVPGQSPSSCPYRIYNHYCKVGNNQQRRLPIHSQAERRP